MTDHRACFDAESTFLNGGGLQVRDFRLDIPGADVSVAEVGLLLVRHLGLLMVDWGSVDQLRRIVAEPHRGGRGVVATGVAGPARCRIDLSRPISAGMTTDPGLPGPEITPHLTREASRDHYEVGTSFAIDRITMVGNTGTYVDSPYHRYDGGTDLAELALESLADLPAVVVHLRGSATPGRAIGTEALAPHDVTGAAVLLDTGWERHWGTAAYGAPDAPYLTHEGATWLVERGAVLVGIDSVNIDDTSTGARPAHSVLLGAGIPDRGAPRPPRRGPARRSPVHRCAPAGRGLRHLPGACLRGRPRR